MGNFTLSEKSKSNRIGIDNKLIQISDYAIQITLIDFGHGPDSGLRTPERQNQLYLAKASKDDGYTHKSKHQSGKALDFYAYVNGSASWEKPHLAMVACAFLQAAAHFGYKVSWGGLWKGSDPIYGWDMAHIQLED